MGDDSRGLNGNLAGALLVGLGREMPGSDRAHRRNTSLYKANSISPMTNDSPIR